MFCVARYDTPFARFISMPLLVALGETSYSIYLVHTWTLRIFEHAAQPFNAFWALDAAFRVALAIVFTLIVSYGTYRLIELPGRAWVRGRLRQQITAVFGPSETPRTSQISSFGPILYTVGVTLFLVLIAVGGQTLRYSSLTAPFRHLFGVADGEITVLSADYGLNCADFPVPRPYPKLVAPGYATKAIKTACDHRSKCEYLVSAAQLGDPANSCGKEFTVKYRCSGHDVIYSAFLPAEADGKNIVLTCR
jgi:hypothetical protein